MKYTVKPTNKFRKDYKLMEKRNMDMSLLDEVISKLAQGIHLPESNRDHALVGNYVGHRAAISNLIGYLFIALKVISLYYH